MTQANGYDVAVIGGGIIGLATARAVLERHPTLDLVVLEKEDDVAKHQTGRNSGVVHSGIYYEPRSLKATLCVEGAKELLEFCRDRDIAHANSGKLIVATTPHEVPRLQALFHRGTENGVRGLRMLGSAELRELEPHVVGLAALHSPATAIVDFGAVARALADDLQRAGAAIVTSAGVYGAGRNGKRTTLLTPRGEFSATLVVNCAGLYADKVALLLGAASDVRIIPFRGEYKSLVPEARRLVNGLVYPVPDPALPFLGAHFTPTVHGEVKVGPNAVLALAREGYTRRTVDAREVWETVTWTGFRKLALGNWRSAVGEYGRSRSRRAFLRALQRLVPELSAKDLQPSEAGVRAQAVTADGKLVDDFRIVRTARAVNVVNAPSPAATASLSIGRYVATLVGSHERLTT